MLHLLHIAVAFVGGMVGGAGWTWATRWLDERRGAAVLAEPLRFTVIPLPVEPRGPSSYPTFRDHMNRFLDETDKESSS